MSTNISVIGTIATDPKLFHPSSGLQLCSFRLASDERRYDREQQGWVEGHTNWFSVVVFRGLAQHAHESFNKGDRIIVTGRLRVRNWEKDDKRGIAVEIEAEALGHDVRWGVSRFDKRNPVAGEAAQQTREIPEATTLTTASVGEAAPTHIAVAEASRPTQESAYIDGFIPRMIA